MRIAILGATSQIARDLAVSFSGTPDHRLYLFARRPDEAVRWLESAQLPGSHPVGDFSGFARHEFDAVINFVGAGDPARLASLGNGIFGTTLRFDEMVLDYLHMHPACRYLFLSSGAVYGSRFDAPAEADTPAVIPVNALSPTDWYGAAKLHAECRHRAHPELSIIDIRVFNYFSRTQNLSARFLITDILRAIRDNEVLQTNPEPIKRDFLHPSDLCGLVNALLASPPANTAVDCYTRAPIDKQALLDAMRREFGLRYEIVSTKAGIDATGSKLHYYSLDRRAAEFGYQPALTSLEGILREARAILRSD